VVALFATLPAESKFGIAPARVANCKRLITEFLHLIAHTHALRRVFVSVKGFYYQAEIEGETLTWIAPHRFSQVLPSDVDYSVMMTFLELYECLLQFVNFRLYTSNNLAYPPKINQDADARGHELEAVVADKKTTGDRVAGRKSVDHVPAKPALSSDIIEAAKQAAARFVPEDGESDEEDADVVCSALPGVHGQTHGITEGDGNDNAVEGEEPLQDDTKNLLFSGQVVVVGREAPVAELVFVLKASGAARVIRQEDIGSDCEDFVRTITYWVIDRPSVPGDRIMSIEYVQPQFVFDSLNAGVLLPPSLYAPGVTLPPHLSPFVGDEEDGGYRPWFKDVIERIKAGDTTVMADSAISAHLKSREKAFIAKREQPNADETEGAADATGAKSSFARTSGSTADDEDQTKEFRGGMSRDERNSDDEEEEISAEEVGEPEADSEKELRLMMMSRKKLKQYSKLANVEKKKSDRKRSLTSKRELLATGVDDQESGTSLKRQRRMKR
jgi:pescadillo